MKGRVAGTENILLNGEKASQRVTIYPGFPAIVEVYTCYSSVSFNARSFTHKCISVLATNCMATLQMRYINAFSCLKDCHMKKT